MNYKNKNLEELNKKIDGLTNKKEGFKKNKKENGAGFGFKISTEIIAALFVGVGIGLIVDNYFNTKPVGLIIFFIFGALAGFLNVYRVMRRIEKQR
ncbi:MAG: ATPase F0F1 [Candidatus Marinimicrobia bacterium]|nr:ATPase F0F1 [Candidatus Neomarinimicrobiota bacterium]|tara:strand:- start:744 stop:1031 length:288 start_codon:yes stop_codon:yes gene_type:complete